MFIEGEERRVKVKVSQSCLTLCDPMDHPWNSPGQNTGIGSLSLLQGIFPSQGLNPGLLHCRQILDQLSYQGSPKLEISKWVKKEESEGRDFVGAGIKCHDEISSPKDSKLSIESGM